MIGGRNAFCLKVFLCIAAGSGFEVAIGLKSVRNRWVPLPDGPSFEGLPYGVQMNP